MSNPSIDLRGAASGPSFEGSTPGYVLTIDADGKRVSPQPVPAAPGGLVSFNGRTTPAAVPTAGDYGTDDITNESSVPGLTDSDALEFLQDETEVLEIEVAAAAAAAAAAQATATAAAAAAAAAQTTANTANAAAATADAKAVAAQQPFRGAYHVDPTFAGTQLGSSSNPFTTCAAAFAAAVTAGIVHGIIYLAPGANLVENVTFPLTGDWEIAGLQAYGIFATKITGNLDISASASARRTLKGIQVTGNLTGNCSAGTQRIFCTEGVSINGATTLTVTGAGIQRLGSGTTDLDFSGTGIQANFFTGAVTIQGQFAGSSAYFATSLSVTMSSSFVNCLMPPVTTFNTAGGLTMWFQGCANDIGGSLGFTVAGGGFVVFSCDGVTLEEFARVGLNITGDIRMQSMLGGRSSSSVQSSNVGVSPLTGKLPKGMMVIEASLTLLTTSGSAAGNAVLNVVYTDATGTLVTEAVTTALNVAGAVGSKARGVLPFSQNGATAASWSVTGITNVTGLTYQCDVRIRQAN